MGTDRQADSQTNRRMNGQATERQIVRIREKKEREKWNSRRTELNQMKNETKND